MARWEFKLPDIGEGVTEGEIVNWLVKPGDVVKEDQPMVEVMTDKATVTIGAPRAGTILETTGKVGEIVKVHARSSSSSIGEVAPAAKSVEAAAPSGERPRAPAARNGTRRGNG